MYKRNKKEKYANIKYVDKIGDDLLKEIENNQKEQIKQIYEMKEKVKVFKKKQINK